MFLKHDRDTHADLSTSLRDASDWSVGLLRSFEYPANVAALAYEPVAGILAVGTSDGIIILFGSPGVECRLMVPERIGIKFLQFAPTLLKLTSLDLEDQLHVWDLEPFGRPKLVASARFDPANSLMTSPSHSHAFVGLQSGLIKTYDLLCHSKSPYTIPNMWTLYEDKCTAGGLLEVSSQADSGMVIDVIPHPRDLNLHFVAYGGGVILSDLTQRSTLHVYELILSPGAPGSSGFASKNLFTIRKPPVTALAIHPTGHFFVVGYADGLLGFWAVDDEDQPILVRTLDEIDVNIVDGEKIDQYLPRDGGGQPNSEAAREPIYRLSWSGFPNSPDPRGGSTVLSVLGGNIFGNPSGVTVFLMPPFNPMEPPASNSQNKLHPSFKQAMRKSSTPETTFLYEAPGIIQDFLLIPRDNPHFSSNFDPVAILLLFEGQDETRLVEAREFPPRIFEAPTNPSNPGNATSADALDELSLTLSSLEFTSDPSILNLPTTLENARSLLGGQLLEVDKDAYQSLLANTNKDSSILSFRGGLAFADVTKTNEFKLAKFEVHRILITYHRDQTVKFHDISAQLLIGSEETPLSTDFPNKLPHLTIKLATVLIDIAAGSKLPPVADHRIVSLQFAAESLECAIGLESGELLIYRPKSENHDHSLFRQASDQEIVMLSHIPSPSHAKYHPYFMLAPHKGPFTAYAICDIGFFAAGYPDGSLILVDLRGPNVILRREQQPIPKKHSLGLHVRRNSVDPVESLTWTICKLEQDAQLRVHLIAVQASGHTCVYTVKRDKAGRWVCDDNPVTTESVESPLLRGSFIIDSSSGAVLKATGRALAATSQSSSVSGSVVWVLCGTKGARCTSNVTGNLLGRTTWNFSKLGSVQDAQIVDKNGSHALVVVTEKQVALVYSLPKLEHLHTLQLPGPTPVSFSGDGTGDFILWKRHPNAGTVTEASYGSFFNMRRAHSSPDIDFASNYPPVPPHPNPVSLGPQSLLGSWFSFGQEMTGDQLDSLLGGPDRPTPKPKTEVERSANIAGPGSSAAGIAAAASDVQNTLYNRLQSAIGERGQMLGDLEQSFNALEEGSKNMVTQAKRLAAQQTAKGWFSGFR